MAQLERAETKTTHRGNGYIIPYGTEFLFQSYMITLQTTSHLPLMKKENPVMRFPDLCPQSLGFNYMFCIIPFSGRSNSLQPFSSNKRVKSGKGALTVVLFFFFYSFHFVLFPVGATSPHGDLQRENVTEWYITLYYLTANNACSISL